MVALKCMSDWISSPDQVYNKNMFGKIALLDLYMNAVLLYWLRPAN